MMIKMATILFLTAFPLLTEAATPPSCFDIHKGVLTEYRCSHKNVVVPPSVTHIEAWAFADRKIQSVTLPPSILRIGDWAFANNRLSHIHLPPGVTHIGPGAFSNNRLSTISFPPSLSHVGSRAFTNNRLSHIHLPAHIARIGSMAFANNRLPPIELPAHRGFQLGKAAFAWNRTAIPIPTAHNSSGQPRRRGLSSHKTHP